MSIREALDNIVEDLKGHPFDNGARGNIRDSDELIPIDYDGLMERVEVADKIEPQGSVVADFKAKTKDCAEPMRNVSCLLQKWGSMESGLTSGSLHRFSRGRGWNFP